MSAFKLLRDVCNNFEQELKRASNEIFSARIGEPFEDVLSKKLQNLNLLSSKLRLLQAKPEAWSRQAEEVKNEDTTLDDYTVTITQKLIESQIVKSVTQAHAVRSLITTPNSKLEPEMIERKEQIIHYLNLYREKETYLRQLDAVLVEKETEQAAVRAEWDRVLGELRRIKSSADSDDEIDTTGRLYCKLKTLVEKLELMRWLISELVTARTSGYDWLSDPHKRYNALKLARESNTIDKFVSV